MPNIMPVDYYPVDVSWCGAQDMSGNVNEWTATCGWDVYTPDLQVDPVNDILPAAPNDWVETRGGCGFKDYNQSKFFTVWYRRTEKPSAQWVWLGFRPIIIDK
jgi:formylglycine-generating enzyme required for sulfatase activity